MNHNRMLLFLCAMAVMTVGAINSVWADIRIVDEKPITLITPDGAICEYVEDPGNRYIVKCPPRDTQDFDFTINGAPVIMGTVICLSPSMEFSCVLGKVGRWDIEMPARPVNSVQYDDFSPKPDDWSREKLADCHWFMQKAMKDWDKYTNGIASKEGDLWVEHSFYTDEGYDKMIMALTQWEEVKRDCWGK